MPKYFESEGFRALLREWREILKEDGFKDIEDDKGRLKNPDRRSIGFQNRDEISNFYSHLGLFLGESKRLPRRDRKILELYALGTWITEIARKLQVSRTTVTETIRKYRRLLGVK